jgi:hypothetical protein
MNLRGTWNRTGIRPRRLAVLFIGFAIVVFGVSPLARFFGIYDFLGFTCDAREKAALTEFPQYGGKVVGKDIQGPLGGEILNFPPLQAPPPGCELSLTARHASPKQVSAYYKKKLTEHGWKARQFPVSPDPESDEPGDTIDAHVGGTREGFHYEVYYSPVNNRENTNVYVLVYRDLAIGDDRP